MILADALAKCPERFDVLIVDETQDIHESWWVVIRELLKLPTSPTVLFHDPEQNIYGRSGALPVTSPIFPLRLNCRNAQPIGEYAARLAGVECRTPSFVGGGEAPQFVTYDSADDEYEKVARRIDSLLKAGIHPDQIVLLGTHRIENSFLGAPREIAGLEIQLLSEDLSQLPTGTLRYSTLHRFKGLEADVVLLCDVDGHPQTCSRRHVYVAASRARHRLYVFCAPGALEEYTWIRHSPGE